MKITYPTYPVNKNNCISILYRGNLTTISSYPKLPCYKTFPGKLGQLDFRHFLKQVTQINVLNKNRLQVIG